MKMEVLKYNEDLKDEWDYFVFNSKNGTIFNTRQFLNYHPADKFNDSSLMFKYKDKLVAVFPAAVIKDSNKVILKSHPGASYGGPVLSHCINLKTTINVVDNIIDYAIDNEIDFVETRIAPRVFQKFPSEEIDYVLVYKDFDVKNVELSSAVQLCCESDKSLLCKFRSDTLRSANKAKKIGVKVVESDEWEKYWALLYRNLMERHKTTPTHSIEELRRLVELLPNHIKLFAAYYKGKMIAGTVVFLCNSSACHTFYIAQDYEFQNIRPINLLFMELLIKLKNSGFRFLNFGISTEAGGTIINPGLFRFKEGFGGCGVARRYYSRRVDKDEG